MAYTAMSAPLLDTNRLLSEESVAVFGEKKTQAPQVISTWNFGVEANADAWKILGKNGRALDAVETGVMNAENDPNNMSVGYGGLPDRDGRVTLDASIMDENGNVGAVSCLEHIRNPISVARRVMEKTPHVMLTGDGALQFALSEGFKKENLLTEKARQMWEAWKIEHKYEPVINIENHDTIGMIALDQAGRMAGACTTSGLAFKMHGRVGDSPIAGAGMYVDNEVGGAVATGHGEFVMRTLGSFLIVEFMRQGLAPQKACEKAIQRIVVKYNDLSKIQVGYLAMDMKGNIGAYAINPGFTYALQNGKEAVLKEAPSHVKK